MRQGFSQGWRGGIGNSGAKRGPGRVVVENNLGMKLTPFWAERVCDMSSKYKASEGDWVCVDPKWVWVIRGKWRRSEGSGEVVVVVVRGVYRKSHTQIFVFIFAAFVHCSWCWWCLLSMYWVRFMWCVTCLIKVMLGLSIFLRYWSDMLLNCVVVLSLSTIRNIECS